MSEQIQTIEIEDLSNVIGGACQCNGCVCTCDPTGGATGTVGSDWGQGQTTGQRPQPPMR